MSSSACGIDAAYWRHTSLTCEFDGSHTAALPYPDKCWQSHQGSRWDRQHRLSESEYLQRLDYGDRSVKIASNYPLHFPTDTGPAALSGLQYWAQKPIDRFANITQLIPTSVTYLINGVSTPSWPNRFLLERIASRAASKSNLLFMLSYRRVLWVFSCPFRLLLTARIGIRGTGRILPLYRTYSTPVSKVFYPCIESILPLYRTNTTRVSKVFYPCIEPILPVYRRYSARVSNLFYPCIEGILPVGACIGSRNWIRSWSIVIWWYPLFVKMMRKEFLDGVKKRWLFYHQVARLFFWCAAGWMSDLQAIHSMSVGGGFARGSRVFDRFGDRFGRRLSYGFLGWFSLVRVFTWVIRVFSHVELCNTTFGGRHYHSAWCDFSNDIRLLFKFSDVLSW